jgi:hypothetical protein
MSQRINSFFRAFVAAVAQVCASLAQRCATGSFTLARAMVVSTVLLALLAPTPARAQDARSVDARVQEIEAQVIAAVLRFVDALEAGDAAALEQSICAESLAQERTRSAFARLAAAQKALERTATTRFGQQGKRFRCGFEIIVGAADRKAIQSAKVHFEPSGGGRVADVEKTGELSTMNVRLSDSGKWQVVLEPIDFLEPAESEALDPYPYPRLPTTQPGPISLRTQIRLTRYNSMIEAFDKTRAGIENGTLATPAAAEAELSRGLAAAAAEFVRARANLPMRGRRQ